MGLFPLRKPMTWDRLEADVWRRLKVPEATPVFCRDHEWKDLVCRLDPGDMGLTVNWPTAPAFGRVYQGRPYTHLFVYLGNGKIAEALLPNVVVNDLDKYQRSTFTIVRWQGITPEQKDFLVDYARDLVDEGVRYDKKQLSWLIGRGLISIAAGPAVIANRLGLAVGLKTLAFLMNRRNLLDQKRAVICSGMAAEAARSANKAGLVPGLPVKKLGAGEGCIAPAHFADWRFLDPVLCHSQRRPPKR